MRRLVSLLLILVGVLLIYWGYGIQQDLSSPIVAEITNQAPEQVWQYYLTGVVALIVGLFSLWKSK